MAAPEIQPQTQPSWTPGEETLAARLSQLASERVVVLHDLRMPAGQRNIDHLAVTPRGVFVIDAKYYSGAVDKRNAGSIFRPDLRLYVGDRECTALLHGVEDQAEVVRDVLRLAGFVDAPVRAVLCFIGAEWGHFGTPFKLGDVLVTYPRFLYRVLEKDVEIATSAIQDAGRVLATVLPST